MTDFLKQSNWKRSYHKYKDLNKTVSGKQVGYLALK